MHNEKIAELFSEIADMLELEGSATLFEIRAYRKAAMTIGTLQEDVAEILDKRGVEGLMALPGIGKGLAGKIKEYVERGAMKKHEGLKKRYPIDFAGLMKIQGLGPKSAFRLYKELGIRNVSDLKKAVAEGRIRSLRGFGEKSELEISKGIEFVEASLGRMLLGSALPEAERIVKKLMTSGAVERAEISGSTRRMKETVGDLDILVISESPEKAISFVEGMEEVESILLRGPTKTTLRLRLGLNCDIRVIEKKSFGAALQYFIGSKEHNVKVRQLAIKKGYKLNEYGLFNRKGVAVAGSNEPEIYERLGMDYPEPEMREDRGEIELALRRKLPRLVQLDDICGDLHTHTVRSDGANRAEEMALEAARLGRSYIGISDHSKSERIAHGMDEKAFARHFAELDKLSEKFDGRIKILKSAETDILKDGSLDLARKTLEEMDYVLASIHTDLNMEPKAMTERIVACVDSGMVDIIAHPTDRIINGRKGISFDFDEVFEAAKRRNVAFEINAFPERLDFNDENIMRASEYGLKFAIGTDSHRLSHLEFMRYGVGMAKRGWLESDDIINTYSYDKLLRYFKR